MTVTMDYSQYYPNNVKKWVPNTIFAKDTVLVLPNLLIGKAKADIVSEQTFNATEAAKWINGTVDIVDAIGDGVTDDTAAFQALADKGGDYIVPEGAYVISSVSITKDIRFFCANGVTFIRKAGTDISQGSYWTVPGTSAMFAVNLTGLNVAFDNFTYNGNKANQNVADPTGMFLRCLPTGAISGDPTVITVSNGEFINGTSDYMALRGDDNQRRYETRVLINNCRFHETLRGIGANDPASPNPLGYSPTYVRVMDYVKVITDNFYADWTSDTSGTGIYAACAINLSYVTSSATSGEASLFMKGLTHVKNLGRATKQWNNDALYTNNGIGVIDAYGNAESVYIENLYAENSKFASVRAKASLARFTVENATLVNCNRGLQVGPSTTGAAETVVNISNVNFVGGVIPAVEVNGTDTTDMVKLANIFNVYIENATQTAEVNALGAVYVKNILNATLKNITIKTAPYKGIQVYDVSYLYMDALKLNGCGTNGIHTTHSAGIGKFLSCKAIEIDSAGAEGISIQNQIDRVVFDACYINTAVNYGIFVNNASISLTVKGCEAANISGTGRGFYSAGGESTWIGNRATVSVATPIFAGATSQRRENNNSWNPKEDSGTAAPTTNTWAVGDRRWNSAPAAGGTLGWICTTAGTPGTWKTFGSIQA